MSLAEHMTSWAPGVEIRSERLTEQPTRAMGALLDRPVAQMERGRPLPPLWHWLYFLDHVPQAELGPDGHPRAGGFLPPIPRRRRMFAGGRLTVTRPLMIGEQVTRRSTMAASTIKHGRTGELLFVTLRHEFAADDTPCMVEEQDLVYRSDASAPTAPSARGAAPVAPIVSSDAPWQFRFTADPVVLFRFSALTYNAHRIHYDQNYAQQVEAFPALVVHGPLLALLLLELPRRFVPQRTVTAFNFRVHSPVFAAQPVLVSGEPSGADAWALSARASPEAASVTGALRLR
jgi:hydroxyacyl-ACP dehydratase HTD2-like protein with hotdog domain